MHELSKELYVVRHAQLDEQAVPTNEGLAHARAVGALLPKFDVVMSGGDAATDQTAFAMSGREPTIDKRAGMDPVFAGYEDEIRDFECTPKKVSITEYVQYELADGELAEPFRVHAGGLSDMAWLALNHLDYGQSGLVVSYGLSIVRAMWPNYLHRRPIMHGYGFRMVDSTRYGTRVNLFAPPKDKAPRPR